MRIILARENDLLRKFIVEADQAERNTSKWHASNTMISNNRLGVYGFIFWHCVAVNHIK